MAIIEKKTGCGTEAVRWFWEPEGEISKFSIPTKEQGITFYLLYTSTINYIYPHLLERKNK